MLSYLFVRLVHRVLEQGIFTTHGFVRAFEHEWPPVSCHECTRNTAIAVRTADDIKAMRRIRESLVRAPQNSAKKIRIPNTITVCTFIDSIHFNLDRNPCRHSLDGAKWCF